MMIPSRDDCRKENCRSSDQQFSRILRRWQHEPLASFDDVASNHQALRVATEFLIGSILKRSDNLLLHEYWCDGTDFVETSCDAHRYFLGGGCKFSDRYANAMWLAPFELSLNYSPIDLDMPSSLVLRLGHFGAEHTISKRYPTGRTYRLYAMAHALYGNRPTNDNDWAAVVRLDPYTR